MILLALAQCRLLYHTHPPYVHNLVRECMGPPEKSPDVPAYVFTIDRMPSAVLYVEDRTLAVHLEYSPVRMLVEHAGALSAFCILLKRQVGDLSMLGLDLESRLVLHTITDDDPD